LLPSHLYVRANGLVTYDVSKGHQVDFKAMTDDGTRVYYTSSEQITPDDHDTSVDLFMWSEAGDTVTRVTSGTGGVGDSDACNASWTTKCSIEIADPGFPAFQNLFGGSRPANSIVSRGDDIYFYSPEQFVGSNGIPGRRNLYVRHQGELQYVATMEPNQKATRFQVSPNGSWAAFITASKLTPYDNQGKEEMYRYDVDSGDLRCVSCKPNGDPPVFDVEGSQNGLYLADDGRAFFATKDQLVPQDTDGITDVYEYTSGAPRLITSGIAQKEQTRFGKVGLVGVSNNGTDVYFSTMETLVAQDRNGAFLKFYDARVNGGFPISSSAAPCGAADECHGSGNGTIPTPRLASTAGLGAGGNAQPKRHKKHHHKKKHKKHHHKKKHKKHKKHQRHGASTKKQHGDR
jgi:hypothetical protein